MPSDETGSITGWIAGVKAGDLAAAQPLWERYFARIVDPTRARLRASGRRGRDAARFYSWDEVNYCRWSPYQPGVLSVHVGEAVHQASVVFGPASRGQMTVPPMIYFHRVPARHCAAVEAAIRTCGKWAD